MMKHTRTLSLLSLVAVSAMAAPTTVQKNGVTIVPPTGTSHADRIDFAELEANYPLDRNVLQALKPEDLKNWDQESLDQLYARLTAGPIPDGIYNGTVSISDGGGLEGFARLVGGLGIPMNFPIKPLAETLWKGKHFYKAEGVLRNMITNIEALKLVTLNPQLDVEKLPKTVVDGKTTHEIFPAKIFCGSSLLDSRKESVIIDYAHTDSIEGYQPGLDDLAGRKGLQVRDEIRMIRPGFYLGRAYMSRAFALNFFLYNAEVASSGAPVVEECMTR